MPASSDRKEAETGNVAKARDVKNTRSDSLISSDSSVDFRNIMTTDQRERVLVDVVKEKSKTGGRRDDMESDKGVSISRKRSSRALQTPLSHIAWSWESINDAHAALLHKGSQQYTAEVGMFSGAYRQLFELSTIFFHVIRRPRLVYVLC